MDDSDCPYSLELEGIGPVKDLYRVEWRPELAFSTLNVP
jgi:hypothetical protein